MSAPGEISQAQRDGYRVTVHDRFFPFERLNSATGEKEVVHAVVDHAVQAIFCSREWFDKLPKEKT